MHMLALPLSSARSLEEHGLGSRGQAEQCSVVWSASPHSHVVVPVLLPRPTEAVFARPILVLRRLSVFHSTHVASAQGLRSFAGIPMSIESGSSLSLSFQNRSLVCSWDVVRGWTWMRKLLLDFSLRAVGWPPWSRWHLLLMTLLMSAGNFLSDVSRDNVSELLVLVGFRQRVLFNAGSNFLSWGDLS